MADGWRTRARRIVSFCFNWRVESIGGVVRATARGATAGHGETESLAMAKAIEATLDDLERDACRRGMPAAQKFQSARRAAILAVHRHDG